MVMLGIFRVLESHISKVNFKKMKVVDTHVLGLMWNVPPKR